MNRKSFSFLFLTALLLCLLTLGCKANDMPQSEATVPSTAVPTAEPTAEPILLGGQALSGSETALKLVLTADEMPLLEQFSALKELDLSGSTCYAEIKAYTETHPEVAVRCTVQADGQEIPNDAAEITVSAPLDPAVFPLFSALQSYTVTEPVSPADAAAMREALPDTALSYAVSFCGLTVKSDVQSLDLSAVAPDRLDEITAALAVLPDLAEIRLDPEAGPSLWTLEDAGVIGRARTDVSVNHTATAFGTSFNLADEAVMFKDIDLRNRVDDVRSLLSCLPHMTRVVFDDCKIPDAQMAELRSEFPSPKVVWRIFVKYYSCYSDAIMIRFSDDLDIKRLHDTDTEPFIYCNEVKYLDLGHCRIKDAYFLAGMPNLEVLILAVGPTTDISALKNCPKLEYCEIFSSRVSDLSPLANCTELEHLNIVRTDVVDITPLFGLKKLKRLWLSYTAIPKEQIEQFKALVPDCYVEEHAFSATGKGWRHISDSLTDYTPRYRLLREQMLYETPNIRSYSEWNRPQP